MLKAQSCLRTITHSVILTNQPNRNPSIPNADVSFRLAFTTLRCRPPKSVVISCKYSRGSFGARSGDGADRDHEYFEAAILLSETISHYQTRKEGSEKKITQKFSDQLRPSSAQERRSRADVSLIGQGFLRRFESPTIFLKISCNGDFVLPIIVGDYAVEKLIDALMGDENGDYLDHYQFARDLLEKLGYEVKWVRITERVVNTYYARLYFSKPGQNNMLSVDARPSDAIIVAYRCKAPIYVNKQILLTDAIRIGYGTGRVRDSKPTYDVILDSAAEGQDILSEELHVVRKMHLAAKEERYKDAAMWRDKLMKLQKPSQEEH